MGTKRKPQSSYAGVSLISLANRASARRSSRELDMVAERWSRQTAGRKVRGHVVLIARSLKKRMVGIIIDKSSPCIVGHLGSHGGAAAEGQLEECTGNPSYDITPTTGMRSTPHEWWSLEFSERGRRRVTTSRKECIWKRTLYAYPTGLNPLWQCSCLDL